MTETMNPTATDAGAHQTVALEIGGMTCASCAARIGKRLNKIEGVEANVNYATERATITFPDTISTDELIGQIEAVGYTAALPRPADTAAPAGDFRSMQMLDLPRLYIGK